MVQSIESHLVLRKTTHFLGGGNFVKTSEEISALQHGFCSVCHSCPRPLPYINSCLCHSSRTLQWEVILAS